MDTNTNTAPAGDPLASIAAEGSLLEQTSAAAVSELAQAGLDASHAGALREKQVALWAMLPKTLGSVLAMAMPELADVYNDKACELWGEAMADVAIKRGWTVDENSPELALLVVSAPFVIGTGAAVMKRKRAHLDRSRQPAPARPGAAPAHHVDAAPPQINPA